MRKHYTQMTPDEHKALLYAVRSRTFSLGSHALDRMREKHIGEAQIRAMLTYASVIECHNDVRHELRVLLRGKVAGKFVCAVVSLTTSEIVTTYCNAGNDYHATLDRSVYNWSIDTREALRLYKCA